MPKRNQLTRTKSESNLDHFVESGNRIIRGDHGENEQGVIVLYRGVKPHAGPFQEQTDPKHSVIGSKKPLDLTKSVGAHIDSDTESSYTSWTPNYLVARKFADPGGVVMRGVFKLDEIIHPVESFGEVEYSIIGTVVGTYPIKDDPYKNMSPTEKQKLIDKLNEQWRQEAMQLEKKQKQEKYPPNDPLKAKDKKTTFETEWTPTGKPVRKWEAQRFFRKLESGLGKDERVVAKNEEKKELKRTKSESNIKLKK